MKTAGTSERSVLLVGQAGYCALMSRQLSEEPDYTVLTATSKHEFDTVLDAHDIDLFVVDLEFYRNIGLHVLLKLQEKWIHRPICFIASETAENTQYKHLRLFPGIQIKARPFLVGDILKALHNNLGTAYISPMYSIIDFIHLACIGRYTCELFVESFGTPLGTCTIARGELWSVRDIMGTGVDALRRLASIEHVVSHCHPTTRAWGERDVNDFWAKVLYEIQSEAPAPELAKLSETGELQRIFGIREEKGARTRELTQPSTPPAEILQQERRRSLLSSEAISQDQGSLDGPRIKETLDTFEREHADSLHTVDVRELAEKKAASFLQELAPLQAPKPPAALADLHNFSTLMRNGKEQLDAKNYQKARRYLTIAKSLEPDNAEVQALLLQISTQLDT
ncbi:MAG: hypothetical protein CL920_15630 [Deltaproteobacteria bacterium]|nr:hypothetical protein [Deltaproteobacteria bacterium]|tara:strand:- start:135 stop:1322 length:1188 start_codon:yes stop_codon:yes gene_type:complete